MLYERTYVIEIDEKKLKKQIKKDFEDGYIKEIFSIEEYLEDYDLDDFMNSAEWFDWIKSIKTKRN